MNFSNKSKFEKSAREVYLDKAKASLTETGQYWDATIPSETAKKLSNLLKEDGFDVKFTCIEPEWEFVFYTDESSPESLKLIARERKMQRDNISQLNIPR